MQVLNEPGEAYFNFVNSINSDVTRKNYEYCMSRFLKYCNLDLNSLLKLPQQELSNLIIKYLVSLKISSQYKRVIVASIKHACEMNDVILNWKKLKKTQKIYQSGNMLTRPRTGESQEIKHECDSVTQCDHLEQKTPLDNNIVEDKSDLKEGRTSRDDHDESPNHIEKCPYCDYTEHPFYLKTHVKFTHPEHYDGI